MPVARPVTLAFILLFPFSLLFFSLGGGKWAAVPGMARRDETLRRRRPSGRDSRSPDARRRRRASFPLALFYSSVVGAARAPPCASVRSGGRRRHAAEPYRRASRSMVSDLSPVLSSLLPLSVRSAQRQGNGVRPWRPEERRQRHRGASRRRARSPVGERAAVERPCDGA